MNQYTTKEIRFCATDGYRGISDDEFDYWLNQHDLEVAKATEERIIKLLEYSYCPLPEKWHLENLQTCFGYCGNTEDYIALIKGERQKDNEAVVLLTEGDK